MSISEPTISAIWTNKNATPKTVPISILFWFWLIFLLLWDLYWFKFKTIHFLRQNSKYNSAAEFVTATVSVPRTAPHQNVQRLPSSIGEREALRTEKVIVIRLYLRTANRTTIRPKLVRYGSRCGSQY